MTTLAQVFAEADQAAHPDMAVLGPAAWAELHAWSDRFAAKVGTSCGCGKFAIDATRAFHDLVSVHLGKKAMYPETLQEVAKMYRLAAGKVNAEQRLQDGVSVEATKDEVNIFHSSRYDRAYWVPAIKKWRVIKYDEHGEVILMVDVATRQEARRILQEVAVSALPLCPSAQQKQPEVGGTVQARQAVMGKADSSKDVFAVGSFYGIAYGDYNKGVVVDAPSDPSWFVATMTKGRSHHGKSFDNVEDAKRDAAVRARRLGLLSPGVAPHQEHGIYPWPEGMFDDEEEEDEGMEQTANPVTKATLRPFEGKSLTLAEVRALPNRAATLRALLEGYIGEHPLPEGMIYFLTAKGEIFLAEKRKAPHLSQSFLDTILHTAIGTGVAIGVSKVLNPPAPSIIKEEEKPKEPTPTVLNPAFVEGDQAQVDLGTLLEEIDAILKKPETMGIVDADTLTIVRE